jgi:structural toxin protein (hemagglutinin/hemolysin) RtxA
MYQISFYVPSSHLEIVKNAMFKQGAGTIGHYSCCAWQVLGEGQFMPLAGSKAFIGEKNKLEKLSEYKVEMVCAAECLSLVIQALKEAHPYEEIAYHILKIETHI